MPRPGLPPTPASSTEMKGRDGSNQFGKSLHLAFELPPPALFEASRRTPEETKTSPTATFSTSANASPQLPYPLQAAETVKSRRRLSAAKDTQDATFTLPPPPTRSRKIIQMKPRAQDAKSPSYNEKDASKASSRATAPSAPSSSANTHLNNQPAPAAAQTQSKKKQPSATSAAGRKMARKTAHSLIERRRRSKMNEEFALLKSMIPACEGEMHKLAILQASIEYVRYLEDCVRKLKVQHHDCTGASGAAGEALPSIHQFHPTFREDPSGDVEMSDSETASPNIAPQPHSSHQSSVSPALGTQRSRDRHHSYSSVHTDHRHYSQSASFVTSPAFGPQWNFNSAQSSISRPGSTLTSPALHPQNDLDQEATAALLMLNHDRRGVGGSGRGLSVRDLLSG